MTERDKIYYCGFWITARIRAWLWRREGRHTCIGKMMGADYTGLHHVGYWVTGVFRND